jgi:hypothetical protein
MNSSDYREETCADSPATSVGFFTIYRAAMFLAEELELPDELEEAVP